MHLSCTRVYIQFYTHHKARKDAKDPTLLTSAIREAVKAGLALGAGSADDIVLAVALAAVVGTLERLGPVDVALALPSPVVVHRRNRERRVLTETRVVRAERPEKRR